MTTEICSHLSQAMRRRKVQSGKCIAHQQAPRDIRVYLSPSSPICLADSTVPMGRKHDVGHSATHHVRQSQITALGDTLANDEAILSSM